MEDKIDRYFLLGIAIFYCVFPWFVLITPESRTWFEVFPYGVLSMLFLLTIWLMELSNENLKYIIWEGVVAITAILMLGFLLDEPASYIVALGKYSTCQFTAMLWIYTTFIITAFMVALAFIAVLLWGILWLMKKYKTKFLV